MHTEIIYLYWIHPVHFVNINIETWYKNLLRTGYVGAERDGLRAIIPKKKPIRGVLSSAEVTQNARISCDRVIVENFFGRASLKFGILSCKFVWDKERLTTVVDVCFSLTNFHINLYPLRRGEIDYYKKIMGDYQARVRFRNRRANT